MSTLAAGAAMASPPSNASGSSEPIADVTSQSRELMKDGASKFSKGDWEGALLAYQKAWTLKQHSAVASNMAAAEMKLGRYADAAEHLKFALSHLPLVQSEKRDAVQAQFDECRKQLLGLRITVNLDGAEILIDGRRIGLTPLWEDVMLKPGSHAVSVSHAGYVTESRNTSGDAGAQVEVSFTMNRMPLKEPSGLSQSAASSPMEASVSRHSDARTWTLVGGAVATAISLGVGIGYRLKSNSDADHRAALRSELDRISSPSAVATDTECIGQSPPQVCSSLHDALVSYDRHRNISTGAFVTSGILGLGTVLTAVLWPTHRSEARRTAWQLVPLLGPGRSGIVAQIAY